MSRFSLHDIAPRLARARDQLREERRKERIARDRHRRESLKAERLVAHRELQLERANATGKGRYIMARRRKLRAAQREMAKYIVAA